MASQRSTGASQDWLDDALLFTVVDERDTAGVASSAHRLIGRWRGFLNG